MSMFKPSLRGLPRRSTVAALLCAQGLTAACGSAATAADAPAWPRPAPPVAERVAAAQSLLPGFEAPSATHCARPVQTVDVPGRPANAPAAFAPDLPAAETARADRSGASSGALAKTEAAAPAVRLREMRSSAPVPLSPAPATQPPPSPPGTDAPRQQHAQVTAGMVDDNADFASYLQFLRGNAQVPHRERDVRERYLLQVRTPSGVPVPDAEVAVRAPGGAAMWARTDSAGRAWLHPRAFDPQGSARYRVAVRKDGREAEAELRRGQKQAVDVVVPDAPAPAPAQAQAPARARLDLVFLVDATGSMDDEIAKLRASLGSIAAEVARLPSRPDLCFGLVAYRDRGDAFLLRRHNLSNDLPGFQAALDALRAEGGGDYPEAMSEALHDTVHHIDWRGNGATRLVVLLADAPPHLDYGGPQYDQDMLAALGKGIKVFSVGASGLNRQGEYIQRQIAQYTGGRFVFLTYQDARNPASGPGPETVHDVRNYSVQTLDRLIVRLVKEELDKLPDVPQGRG